MTIEERAKKYADDIATTEERGWMDRSDIYEIAKDAHIAGATEQKAIDDADLHKRFEKVLNGQKWDLIDKACEWLKNSNGKMFNGFLIVYTQGFIRDFRKAMEDSI